MLQAGTIIILRRARRKPALVQVDGRLPNGLWHGSEVINGRANHRHHRAFTTKDVKAVQVTEGFRCILPGVIA